MNETTTEAKEAAIAFRDGKIVKIGDHVVYAVGEDIFLMTYKRRLIARRDDKEVILMDGDLGCNPGVQNSLNAIIDAFGVSHHINQTEYGWEVVMKPGLPFSHNFKIT